jgi:preprotein translocase subunit SecD
MRRGLVWSLVFFIGVSVIFFGVTIASGNSPLLGLDLRGGLQVVLQPQGTANDATLSEAVSIIDRRVNGLGVANSSVSRQGHNVVIDLPGIKDARSALQLLGTTAILYFRPVLCQVPPYSAPTPTSTTVAPHRARPATPTTAHALGAPASDINLTSAILPAAGSATTVAAPATTAATSATTAGTSATTAPATAASGGTVPLVAPTTQTQAENVCSASNSAEVPSTQVNKDTGGIYGVFPYYDNSVRYVLGPADMTGAGVSNAAVSLSAAGQYEVTVTFTSKGATEFNKIAAERYPYYQQNPSNPPFQSLEAFELDGVVESAPTMEAPNFGNTAVISGSTAQPFSSSQANNLAVQLKYGSLPVRFTPQSTQTVSATIGKDSLKAGLAAGFGGLILVLLYMIYYYRALGFVVLLGLLVEGALLYSIITWLSQHKGLALTLSGVTGLIVSIGITVDSYVVYFERLKDEVRAGRTVRQSVDRAFARAFRTVLTADFVAFLAALILYILTVSDVRGFAFMLGLSTILDVVTAYLFIRPMVILVGRKRVFTEARHLGINRGLNARESAGDT